MPSDVRSTARSQIPRGTDLAPRASDTRPPGDPFGPVGISRRDLASLYRLSVSLRCWPELSRGGRTMVEPPLDELDPSLGTVVGTDSWASCSVLALFGHIGNKPSSAGAVFYPYPRTTRALDDLTRPTKESIYSFRDLQRALQTVEFSVSNEHQLVFRWRVRRRDGVATPTIEMRHCSEPRSVKANQLAISLKKDGSDRLCTVARLSPETPGR